MNPLPIYLYNGHLCYFDGHNYIPIDRILSVLSGGSSGGGGGGGGIKGLIIEDHGTPLPGKYKDLDFEGAGVTVADAGTGKAVITIPGYVIASLTTTQRLALTPTTALIVEDTDIDQYFKWSTITSSWSPF